MLARLDAMTRSLVARGADLATAKMQAIRVIDMQISGQASVLAFSRIYSLSGLALVGALPLLLLCKTGRARGAVGPVH